MAQDTNKTPAPSEKWGENDKPAPTTASADWGGGDKEYRPEPPARGLKGWGQDIAATAVKGAIAVPEALVGLADIPTGGRLGKFLENEGGAVGFRPKQAKEQVNDWHSDATKEAQRKFQAADGIVDKAGVALANPSLIATAVGESLPSMGLGGVAARGLMAATKLGQMGAKGAVLAGAAGEGATMAGSQAEQIRQETEDGRLTAGQAGLATATGMVGGAFGVAGGKLAQRLGIGDAETLMAQGIKGMDKQFADKAAQAAVNPLVADAAVKSIPRKVIEGAIAEGFLEELPQSMAEQIFQNVALDKPWHDELDSAVVMGVLSGGAMGAGAAGFHGFRDPGANAGQPAVDSGAGTPAAPDAPAPAPGPGMQRVAHEFAARLQALQEQEQGEAAVPQTTPPDGAAALAQHQAQAQAARDAEMAANRAVESPDDEILASTGAAVRPSEALGLRYGPESGSLENAAALAMDTGAHSQMQQAAALAQDVEAAGKGKAATQKQEQSAQDQQAVDLDTGEISGMPSMADWSDADLSNAFRHAQGKNVRQQLAQELSRRRTAREEAELQAELQSDQAANDMPDAPDSAFARVQEDAGALPKNIEIQSQAPAPGSQAEGANVATLAQLNRKTLAEMADDELQQLSSLLPADHSRQQKIQKAIKARVNQSQNAINEGANADGTKTFQAQQGSTQPSQQTAQGLNNAPPAPDTGRQADAQTAPEAQAPKSTREQRAARVDAAGQQWTRMPAAERSALVGRLDGVKPVIARNLPGAQWDNLNADIQRKLAEALDVDLSQPIAEAKNAQDALSDRLSAAVGAAKQALQGEIDRAQADGQHTGPVGLRSLRAGALARVGVLEQELENAGEQARAGALSAQLAQERAELADLDGRIQAAAQPQTRSEPTPSSAIAVAASEAATSQADGRPGPTAAQIEAGNYRKGHVRLNGHDIAIENPAGTKRRPEWPALKNHYGYIKGSVGADKDHVDLFMTDRADDSSLPVFVVDQNNQDGGFDEHKVVMGAASEAEARSTYLANYSKGWGGLGAITQMTQDEFKVWVKDPAKTVKPVGNTGAREAEAETVAGAPKNLEVGSAGAVFSTTATPPAQGMPVQRVQEIADRVLEHLGIGAVDGHTGERRAQAFHSTIEVGWGDNPVPGTSPSGATHNGKIYLFAQGLGNELDVFRVVVHELFHLGLSKTVAQGAYIQKMLGFLTDPMVRQYAQRWRQSADGQSRQGKMPVNNWHALSVEEALSDIAEDMYAERDGVGTRFSGWAQRMASRFAKMAERMGLSEVGKGIRALSLTEAEHFVQSMLRKADIPGPVLLRDRRFRSKADDFLQAGQQDLADRIDGEEDRSAVHQGVGRRKGADDQALFKEGDSVADAAFDTASFLKVMGQGARQSSPEARGQAIAAVQQVAELIRAAWINGPKVVVAFDMQDPVVPEAARRVDLKQRSGGARGTPEGFFYRGQVYLMASQLKTPNDTARVLFHEALGHYGLRGAFGKELDSILHQVAIMRQADVDAKIKEYGLRGGSALDRLTATEEVLAEMAQATPKLNFVKRAISAIRNWLRTYVPGFRSLEMSDADIIRAFILPARRFVEQGISPQSQELTLAFSRSAMKSVDENIAQGGAALAHALTEKTTVHRAMFRNGLGWVDFVWGSEGVLKAIDKTKGGMGLAHILEARQRKDGLSQRDAIASMGRVVSTIARGEETERITLSNAIAVKLEHNGYRVSLIKNPGSNAWVVTGFELSEMREQPDFDARKPVQSKSTPPRSGLRADSLATDDSVPSLDRATRRDSTERGSPAGADDTDILAVGLNESNLAGKQGRGSDGSPMFSRAELADLKTKALDQSQQALSLPGKVSLWDKAVGTATDRAVMDMVREGQSAQNLLKMIAGTSRSRFNRQLARLLLKAGINPAVHLGEEMGGGGGFKFLAKYSRVSHALTLTEGAAGQAEQIMLHEMMHAATLRALDRKGLASLQMRRLFEHVKAQGGAAGQYGMKNVGEFVAEAFTNPAFQRSLKTMSAPSQSKLARAWDGFVRILKNILGIPHDTSNALAQALELGVAVMVENKRLKAAEQRSAEPMRVARNFLQARQAVKEFQGKSLTNDATGMTAVLARNSLDKMLSSKAVSKSETPATHSMAVANADSLFKQAIWGWSKPDRSDDANIKAIHRFFAPLQVDGRTKLVKLTVKESVRAERNNPLYTVEAVEFNERMPGVEWVTAAALEDGVILEKENPLQRGVGRRDSQQADPRATLAQSRGMNPDRSAEDVISLAQRVERGNLDDTDSGADAYFGAAQMRDLKDSALGQLHQNLSHPGKVSLWDKTVGTMRNLGERVPQFKPVFEAAQRFIDDVSMLANDAADAAPRLIPRVETLADLKKKPITAVDNKAVAKPLFEGTLLWARDIDGTPVTTEALNDKYRNVSAEEKAQIMLRTGKLDERVLKMWKGMPIESFEKAVNSKFESSILKPGVVWSAKELETLFNSSKEQVSLYQEARAAIDRSIDVTARADMLRAMGEDFTSMREAVLEQPTLQDAFELVVSTLQDEARANPGMADRLMDISNTVVTRFETANNLMDHGYAPLSRFGKYTVDVVSPDGEREYFGMFESKREANQMADKMRDLFKDAAVTQGTMSEKAFKLFAGITPESLEQFGSMLGLESTGDEAKDKAFQAYLQLAKNNHSALKRLIHRKGIDGYSEDVGRVLASFVYSNARLGAGGLNAGTMEKAVEGIPKEMGELRDVAMGLRSYIQDPQEEGQAIRGMLFAQYLGGSVASAMVNMTQPFQITMPWLSQYGGMAKAGQQMARALKDMATKGHQYEPELAKALKDAEDDGTVSPQEIHQLMAQARGTGSLRTGDGTKLGDARAAASNNWERVKVAWGQPFALAEQFNRRSTFIAAFRTAGERGIPDAAEFARNAVLETQFLYSKANKPQWARGAIGGTLFTFKTYSVSYLELMHRMWTQGGPEGKRAVGWAVAMLILMAGAGGLPFVEDLEDLIDGAGQLMGYNLSTKQARKEFLDDILGKELSEFMEQGMSGLPGAPIDVSGRLGLGNLIPGTGLFMSKQNRERDLLEIAGPAGDLVARGFTGVRKALTGDVAGAALELSPTAVRNAAKGIDMATSGIYKDTKGYKVMDVTLAEAASKFAGFQPKSVAEDGESSSFKQRTKSFYIQTSADIKAQWAAAVFNKDDAALERVRTRLESWNRNNPDLPITIKIPDIMKKVWEMGKDRVQRINDTAPKALRQQFREMAQEAGR